MGTSEFIVSWSEVRVDLETPKFAPEVREVLRRMVPLALSLTGLLQHTYKKKKVEVDILMILEYASPA